MDHSEVLKKHFSILLEGEDVWWTALPVVLEGAASRRQAE
jgi:hypothetical protein